MDERGFVCRTFDVEIMRAAGINPAFPQDSLSRLVRGMPVRRGDGEAKFVRCWLIPVRRTSSPP